MKTKLDLLAIQRRQLDAVVHGNGRAGRTVLDEDVPALLDEALEQRALLQWCLSNLVEIEKDWGSAHKLEEVRSLIATLERCPSARRES